MRLYHKIQTVFDRDPATKHRTLIEGQWAKPEFELLADLQWEWTEKIDGTNIRIIRDADGVTYGGRSDNAQIPAHLTNHLVETFGDNQALLDLGENVTLYGEGFGARIQKGGGNYIPDGCGFILFDVKIGDYLLRREDVYDVAKRLGIPAVPVVGFGTLHEAVDLVRGTMMSAFGPFVAEGLVMRPQVDLYDRSGHRVIAKIKTKDFPR